MTERLNELSNNVLITLQSGKKIAEAVVSLRELYLYLFKHSVPLPSTTYNYLLNAIQVLFVNCEKVKSHTVLVLNRYYSLVTGSKSSDSTHLSYFTFLSCFIIECSDFSLFQDRENSRLGNPVICQLTVLVLFQANRPVKQLQKGYTRVGDLLKVQRVLLKACTDY